MKSSLGWICKVAIVCLLEQLSVIQGHGNELPPLFPPVLSLLQPFHDLSILASEAPGQTVAVKGEKYSRVEGNCLSQQTTVLMSYPNISYIFLLFSNQLIIVSFYDSIAKKKA